ncbi:MAG: tryptophan-rich sensory protein [Rhodobacteraceae bacterium]|nr:MAG: tryptophan-rich sensory protein [Paracoccaceae bacterium]
MFGIDFVLLGFIAVNVLAAMSGAVFKPGPWYEALEKPWWNPPKWAFPVAWTAIFALIVIAGWWAWRAAGGFAGAPWAFVFYGLQLLLNAGWSAVFFGMRRPDLALVEVGALWLSIAVTAALFFRIAPEPGALMLVYLAWVTFAARLNHKIWRLNPDNGARLA